MNLVEFFDCNVCLGVSHRPENHSFPTAEQLLDRMDYYGIQNALVYHEEAISDPVSGNELLIREITGYDRLYGCAVLAPSYSGEFGDIGLYFKGLKDSGIRAVRLFPEMNNYPLKSFCLDEVMIQAAKQRMPVLIDCIDADDKAMPYSAWNFSPDYVSIYELATEFPDVNFIIIMPGMLTQRTQYSMMAKRPNVYFECTGFGYKNIEYICQRFSAEKLIFGTYSPRLEPGAYISYIMYADVSVQEKIRIASGNLKRLVGVE